MEEEGLEKARAGVDAVLDIQNEYAESIKDESMDYGLVQDPSALDDINALYPNFIDVYGTYMKQLGKIDLIKTLKSELKMVFE